MEPQATIHRRIKFHTAHGRKVLASGNAPLVEVAARVPRVTRLMALAIHLETLIASGAVPSYSALAQLAHVSRARVTQITLLATLAPDIQEAILFLAPVRSGADPFTERDLRPIVREVAWARQRRLWRQLLAAKRLPAS